LKSRSLASEEITNFLAIPRLFREALQQTALALALVDGEDEIQHPPQLGAMCYGKEEQPYICCTVYLN
jgi:hypothetical protein